MTNDSATEQIGDKIETALYVCQTAPYPRLDLQNVILPHWAISLVVEGAVRMESGGRKYAVLPGDVMIHPPNIAFGETNPHAGLHLWLACTAKVYDPHPENLLDRYSIAPVVSLDDERFAAYRATFVRLQSAHTEKPTSTNRLRRMVYLTELLTYLIEAWEETGGHRARPNLRRRSHGSRR